MIWNSFVASATHRAVKYAAPLAAGCMVSVGSLAADAQVAAHATVPQAEHAQQVARVDAPALPVAAYSTSAIVPPAEPALPDAPQPVVSEAEPGAPQQTHASVSPQSNGVAPRSQAPRYSKYINANQTAYGPLTAHDKIIIGAKDLYSVGNIGAMLISSGYEQVIDGAPNYGTPNAYGKRLGAAAIRETTQGVFTDMVFSTALHTDPRYFQYGKRHGFVARAVYAGTRVLITRTDSGHSTINAALLGGYAASTALQLAYYPQINRNFRDSASEYGGSVGGSALGNVLTEFTPDILHALHLDRLHY